MKVKLMMWLFTHLRRRLLIEIARREECVRQIRQSPMFTYYDEVYIGDMTVKEYIKGTKEIKRCVTS